MLVNPVYKGQSFKPLAEASWAEIAYVSSLGKASEVYALKDTKDIELDGIGPMTLEIADFDHDYLGDSETAETAGITFLTKDLLYQTYQMNTTNTNIRGFPGSALYETLSTDIWNAIPEECRNAVRTIYKWYGRGNATNNGQWFGSKIWVPLEYEMFGTIRYATSYEQSTGNARKYPIFTDNNSRIKKMNNGAGSARWYWEASPSAGNTEDFCSVGSTGAIGSNGAGNAGGVCFGLCV